jgi:hypothetical protein
MQADLRKLRGKVITNISHETARACEMSYAELRAFICGGYYPSERQQTALLRYFHMEERV